MQPYKINFSEEVDNVLMPKVSIIIPVFNTEKYIKKCIDSILKQTYKEYEIWLIDDGSTDNSAQYCDEFAQKYDFIHVIHKENEGQGVARNVALDLCNGEYISFVDSDDSLHPEFLEKMVGNCEKHNAQMCICGYTSDSGLRRVNFCPSSRKLKCDELMYNYLTKSDIGGFPWNKVYHKSLLSDLRFPSFRANEDAYLMADIIKKTELAVVISEPLYVQYVRSGSTERTSFSEKKLALLKADLHLIDVVNESFPQFKKETQRKYARSICALMQGISDSGQKEFKTLFCELHKEYFKVIEAIDDKSVKGFGFLKSSVNITYIVLKMSSFKKKIRAILKNVLVKMRHAKE